MILYNHVVFEYEKITSKGASIRRAVTLGGRSTSKLLLSTEPEHVRLQASEAIFELSFGLQFSAATVEARKPATARTV